MNDSKLYDESTDAMTNPKEIMQKINQGRVRSGNWSTTTASSGTSN